MKKNLLAILTISLSLLFLVISTVVVFAVVKKTSVDTTAIQRIFILPVEDFRPEPQERSAYVVDTLALPCLLVSFYLVVHLWMSKIQFRKIKMASWFLSAGAVIGLLYLTVAGLSSAHYPYLQATGIALEPRLTLIVSTILILVFIGCRFINNPHKKIMLTADLLSQILVGVFIGLISAETIFNETEPFVSGVSFVAYFDSVVQVYLGKTLLVDINSQYGLYALLLKPLFQIIGLSVLKFTLLMGIFKAVIFTSLFLLLRKITRSKLIAFLGFASIVFFMRIRIPIVTPTDPYFQYDPHRLIFPTIFVLLLYFYFASSASIKKNILYVFLFLFCAVSILWNPDTGLVVMATWVLSLIYEEFLLLRVETFRFVIFRSLKHIFVFLVVVVAVILAFCLYTFAYSRTWPDLSGAVLYTNQFYFYGYFLLPMYPIHSWNLVVLVYIVGLFLSISYLINVSRYGGHSPSVRPKDSIVNKIILPLSILGIGLFNYYIGRSHDWNLISVGWPALLLLTIFADKLFFGLAPIIYSKSYGLAVKALILLRQNFKVFIFLELFYFLSSSLVSIVINLSTYQDLIVSRLSGVMQGAPQMISSEVQFIETTSNDENKVLILSDYAPELYLYTHHVRPINVPGFGEFALKTDMDKTYEFLLAPPDGARIYWDPDFQLIDPYKFSNLVEVSSSPDAGLVLFEDKSR